ncbi:hypothetical protein [Lentzea sp. NPDC059081]|uniref:hypothetical protein n=1 Tax=Lentzea sp. NPDC059081 TaxID=3346719 RepID=UPI0036C96A42
MSMPSIPGYLEPHRGGTLADLWTEPENIPSGLWPAKHLRKASPYPAEWLTIEEHFFTEAEHGGTGCVLVPSHQTSESIEGTTWIGRDLGDVAVWNTERFDNGLTLESENLTTEFFAQARRPSGSTSPVIELSHTFLWYWDAFPVKSGWSYLNRAGREQELVRWKQTDDSWKVEVRALELRSFLADSKRSAIIQFDYVTKIEHEPFERVDDSFRNEWAHLDFHCLHDRGMMSDRPAFSRLVGQYIISGLKTSRLPRWEERQQDRDYPTFIYGVDTESGKPLTHTCDPDNLGTYFDKDGTRLHYLTPVYFKREVLQPYAAEPARYSLSSNRLSCLNLWGISISFNSIGLVEAYLGDLGRDLPSDEWGHWRSYNVPPEGKMDEGRFRRDFLGQWASSKDVIGDLRRARAQASKVSSELLGSPLWKPLDGDIAAEFQSLIGPLTEDPAALGASLLVLTKAMIDAINNSPLKSSLDSYDKGDQSLRLLQRYVQQIGGEPDTTAILFNLQGFRSRGGIAHLAGSQKAKAAADLGIEGLSNIDAFESVVTRITSCLSDVTDLLNRELHKKSGGESDGKSIDPPSSD